MHIGFRIASISLVSLLSSAALMAEVPASDNAAVNKQHNGETGVSADQQANDKTDVELTRKIRQAIVQDKSLSTYAHNVKIIASKGSVVLKGPVRSDAEKQTVESKAAEIAGRERVQSEIEVAAK